MDYNTHMHHEDQKPVFLHDPQQTRSQVNQSNFHHRIHDLPQNSSMEVKLIDTSGPSGNTRSSRAAHSHSSYDFNPQAMDTTGNFVPNSPPMQHEHDTPSPSSSPAPVSAAAEYLRHQELQRGQPRKRVYQDWNQVAVFNSPSEAEEGIRNFENCRWKVGNKFTSREGFKVYWSCREGASCPVQIHLLYHSQLPRVVLFRNQPAHLHTEKVKTRGLLPEVEALIRELFANGVNKPRRIQFILQKRGMEEVPQTKLSNFLVKLRREASMQGGPAAVKRGRDSFNDEFDDEDEDGCQGGAYSSGHDDKSNNALSPAMFPSVILSTPTDHQNHQHSVMNQGYPPHNQMNQGYSSNTSAMAHPFVTGQQQQRYPSPGYGHQLSNGSENGDSSVFSPPPHRQSSSVYSNSGRSSAAAGKDGEADQSEVVTCSSSRTRSLYCRDESTEDGEQCLPDEENIKDLVLNHIRMSYSNRDMLLIRQELKMLKRENKYTALSRLLAFTASFLQDSFLEKRDESSPGTETDN